LWQTRTLGIVYSRDGNHVNEPLIYENAIHPLDPNKELPFQVFADSAYADSPTKRSTFGNVTMLNGGPISWSSTLAKTVALSTAESEINSAVEAAKLALHLRNMLMEMSSDTTHRKIIIGEDNTAAISQASKGIRAVRNAKHYEVRLRFLQEVIESGEVGMTYCETGKMLADMFTNT
jgi:hypothetical protein